MGVRTTGLGHFAIPTAPAAGTSCTSGAANTFTTTYVQLIASTNAALFITGVHLEAAAAKAATYIIIQLAAGAAGSEVVIGQYLVPLTTGSTVALGYRPIFPYVPVPNATRIACKTADSVGSAATLVTLECINQTNVVDDGVAVATVTTLTNLPAITANWLTATGINASALNGKGDWLLAANYTAPTNLTAAQIATGIFQDTTAGDFTAANSIGKSIMNGVALGTGLTINGYTGNTVQTGDSFARVGAAGAGLTALGDTRIAHLDADVSSRMATFSLPTNFSSLAISATGHISNVDTLTTYTGNTVQTGDAYGRLGAPAGASIAADIAAVKTDTAAIKVQTDKLTFTVASKLDCNMLMVNSVTVNGAGTSGSPWGP